MKIKKVMLLGSMLVGVFSGHVVGVVNNELLKQTLHFAGGSAGSKIAGVVVGAVGGGLFALLRKPFIQKFDEKMSFHFDYDGEFAEPFVYLAKTVGPLLFGISALEIIAFFGLSKLRKWPQLPIDAKKKFFDKAMLAGSMLVGAYVGDRVLRRPSGALCFAQTANKMIKHPELFPPKI